ncbi:response regulator [Paenibacillus arenilitoris]|uniref:Response regulator n=1 Tax=Paenibacillus arenilitoris TaxID=2772299 RepID=A0A927CUY0_9BACL|nr:response regulator [Paenibacillus arenilitoris]MBD2872306.1 response regulator [Paenibacillus arenilitoris]
MIRVVLADDEPIIIKGLRKLIDWEAFGMEIVGQADDGNELMQRIEELDPAIVISDISMPHRSGIDIIKEIKERGLPVKVIFISAYQEFSYARDAVAYGAVDYLVKPVVKRQLENVLEKALSLISLHHEEEKRKGKLRLLERKSRHEELQDALIQMTDGNLAPQSKAYRDMEAKLPGPYYSVALIEIDRLKDGQDRWNEKERKLIEFAIGNVLQEAITDAGIGFAFVKRGMHVVAASHDDPEGACALAEDARSKIETFLKLKASVAVSRAVGELAKLAEAYREAEHALQMKFFVGGGRVLRYVPPARDQSFSQELYERQWAVIRCMTTRTWEEAGDSLRQWLEIVRKETYGNRSLAVSACFSSVVFIFQELAKSGLQPTKHAMNKSELQSLLASFESFDEMGGAIMDMFRRVHEEIGAESGNKDKLVLAKVKQYIDEHYAEDLTLETMAGMVYMNPYYFSSFFKKHTKQNFKPYVTEVRMNHAARLLAHTDLMIYEVAEKVGYNNARHFSDMFKKQYGQLPNDYRQASRNNG